MANSIANAINFVPVQDAKYRHESKTAILDTPADAVRFLDAKVVKYRDTVVGGLHDHGSNNRSDVKVTWNAYQLDYDREATIVVDDVDSGNAGGEVMADAIVDFMDSGVIPEVDAYRFAVYAKAALEASNSTEVAFDELQEKGASKSAIEQARLLMKTHGCTTSDSGLILFASPQFYTGLTGDFDRVWTNESGVSTGISDFNGLKIVEVTDLFATAVELKDGSFGKAEGGKDIAFMIVDPKAVLQCNTYQFGNYFPSTGANAWQGGVGESAYQYRNVGGAAVRKNMTSGIFVAPYAS